MVVKELFAKLGIKVDKAGIKQAQKAFDSFDRGLKKLGLVAVGAATSLGYLVDRVATTGKHVATMSRNMGISRENLQGLGHAAELAGASSEHLESALMALNMKVHAASLGSKGVARDFGMIGVSMFRAGGGLKNGEELLRDIADRLAKMPDGTRKTALAIRVLGESASELMPLLSRGSAGLDEYRRAGERYGATMTDELIDASVAYVKAKKELGLATQGLKLAIFEPGVKLVSDVVHWLTEMALQARPVLKASAEFILQWKVIEVLVGNFAILLAGRAGYAVVAFSYKLEKLILFVRALGRAGVKAIVAPALMGAAYLALAGLIYVVFEDIIKFFKGTNSLIGEMTKSFDELWETIDDVDPNYGDNHPVRLFLLSMLYTVTHLEETWKRWKGLLSTTKPDTTLEHLRAGGEMPVGGKLKTMFGNSGYAPVDNLGFLDRMASVWHVNPEERAKYWGGGSTPAASVSSSNSTVTTNNSRVNASRIHVEQHITAAPGMSETEVAKKAREEFERLFEAEMSYAGEVVAP